MRVPAHRALLAAVSAVAATVFVSGAAAASLTPASSAAGASQAAAGRARPTTCSCTTRAWPGRAAPTTCSPPATRPGPSATATSRSGPRPTCGTGPTPARCSRTSPPGSPRRWAASRTCGHRTSPTSAACWHLYYAGSSFGSNNSVIGLATTPTLDPHSPRYHWTDDGQVFRSSTADDYNAIDPSLVSTPSGAKYLVFGSYWSGIKLLQLDPATGKPSSASPVISRGPSGPPRRPGRRRHHLPRRLLLPVRVVRTSAAPGSAAPTGSWSAGPQSVTGPYVDPAATER